MKNGHIWQDVDGNDIQAHGGCIINHEGVYYWYGENKGADNKIATFVSGQTVSRVDVIGISCYSSTDLVNWKYERSLKDRRLFITIRQESSFFGCT